MQANILSPGRLAISLGAHLDRLEDIASNKETLYQPFERVCRGKRRTIDRPITPLSDLQKEIYRRFLRGYPFPEYAHGGVPGKSIFTATLCHVRQPVVVTVDLKNFYPSISQSTVFDVWKQLGCGRDVARLLAVLTTRQGALPQGASTSMALANLAMASADLQIALRLSALGRGVKYTRYVDDLLISGPLDNPQIVFNIVADAVRPLGLTIQRSKRRIMWRNERQTALGLNLNDRLTVPSPYRRKLRAAVYNLARYQRGSVDAVMGRLEFVKTAHPADAARLLTSLQRTASAGQVRRASMQRARRT